MQKITICFFFICFLMSCQDKEELTPESYYEQNSLLIPDNIYTLKGYNLRNGLNYELSKEEILFEKISKALAKKNHSKAFKKLLNAEAEKKFDGDFDILMNKIKDPIFENSTLQNYLLSEGIDISKYPLLNISIPLHIEKWDYEKNDLLVVSWVNEKVPFAKAYDQFGKEYYLDQIKEPNVPVIVIGYNERVDENGNIKKVSLGKSSNQNLKYAPLLQMV